MYHAHFGLQESPFSLTPDPRYLFMTTGHREALASMIYGIRERKGFALVLGEVGTGKTTLIRHVLGVLGDEIRTVLLFQPGGGFLELLRQALGELGLSSGPGRAEMIDTLNRYLLGERKAGRWVVFLVDEAQHLSEDVLEELRLLSNLETATSKLLQLILVGQPELGDKLARRSLRQLRQRIGLVATLAPLSRPEMAQYIEHRLRVAGRDDPRLFTRGALRVLWRSSRGIPRLVNVLCDKALVLAYAADERRVRARRVRQVLRDWRVFEKAQSRPPRHERPRRRRVVSVGTAAVTLAAAVVGVVTLGPQLARRGPVPAALAIPMHSVTAAIGAEAPGAAAPPPAASVPIVTSPPPVPAEVPAALRTPSPAPSEAPAVAAPLAPREIVPAADAVGATKRNAAVMAALGWAYDRVDLTLLDVAQRMTPRAGDVNLVDASGRLRLPALGPEAFVIVRDGVHLAHIVTLAPDDRTGIRRVRSVITTRGGVPHTESVQLGHHRGMRILAGDFTNPERANEFRILVRDALVAMREAP